MVKIQFLGAAETVTGSSYLVTYDDTRFIVDCGMFQGPDVEARNAEPWPFDAKTVDFVLLTHSHIDHSGLLPKLTKAGFTGNIYATSNTVAITSLLLLDSAKIQELNAKAGKRFDEIDAVKMYYSTTDSQYAISRFKSIRFNEMFQPAKGINVEYIRAGHVLGAASIIIEMDGKRFAFSGDIGRGKDSSILTYDLNDKREVDYVVMESLYGGQLHPSRESSLYQLMEIVKETTSRGGNVLIPAFAVQRTQDLLLDFKHAKSSGALPADLPVYLDSPLAIRVTDIYTNAQNDLILDESVEFNGYDLKSPFDFPGLKIIRNSRASKKLKMEKGCVIIAGSGMVNGGRMLTHVVSMMTKPANHLVLVGYQAEETFGRLLSEGVKELVIDDIPVTIEGKVTHLFGFSAHGDESDLLAWLGRYKSERLKKIFLIHAEPDRSEALKNSLRDKSYHQEITIPHWKQTVQV